MAAKDKSKSEDAKTLKDPKASKEEKSKAGKDMASGKKKK
jgi:hypothetical protein